MTSSGVADLLQSMIRPGETITLTGRRGDGKTATAISIGQHAMQGDWGHDHVEIITNVVFGKSRGHGQKPVEAYPAGVHHEITLAGTMRRVGSIIDEYGSGGCTIIWLLDEAQNFMLADLNSSRENMALTKYLGNARKFDVCNLFLTPALNNLTPRVRCFPTGESKSGYCSYQITKDRRLAAAMAKMRQMDPRSISFVRTAAEAAEVPIYIETTPWTRCIYSAEAPGNYGYDTKSTATFSVGENSSGEPFSFEKFIKATSGGLSHQLPEKIEEFFAKWETDEIPEDYDRIRIREQCSRLERMRESGLTWPVIATIEAEIETTLKSRFYKWRPSSVSLPSRKTTNDDHPPCTRDVYIQPAEEEDRLRPRLVDAALEGAD